jgi:hypothetical protein
MVDEALRDRALPVLTRFCILGWQPFNLRFISRSSPRLSVVAPMTPDDIIRFLIAGRLFERLEVLAMSVVELYATMDYVCGKRPKGWRAIG